MAPIEYIGTIVTVTVDRRLGSTHPEFGWSYPVNYGFIEGTLSGDGEPLDAYLLTLEAPLDAFTGRCIAVVQRDDDDDPKLVVVPDGVELDAAQIAELTWFQERFFRSRVLLCQSTS